MSKGTLFIISAASGSGKTSLSKSLVKSLPEIALSVSYTTRPMRDGEKEGIDYHFLDINAFTTLLEEDAFLENAQVFGHYYGTPQAWVEETLAKGIDVVLEIDWQGARQIRSHIPGCQSIFILPPSLKELEHRLRERHPHDHETVDIRMKEAKEQLSHYSEYDYLVCNEKFEQALADLISIVHANRLHWHRQHVSQESLLKQLLR